MASAFATSLARQQGSTGITPGQLMIPIVLRSFAPLPPLLSLSLPANATLSVILLTIINHLRLPKKVAQLLRLTRLSGQNVGSNMTVGQIAGSQRIVATPKGPMYAVQPVTLEVRVGTKGGKGGFGSMLRAQGGKMSAGRRGEENNNSCRDLNGRRLSTMKQAKQLASYLEREDERQKQLDEKQKKKYEKLEKMLGRKPRGENDFVEAARKLEASGGSLDDEGDGEGEMADRGEGSSRSTAARPSHNIRDESNRRGTKRERIDDNEYIEQSREIVDNVRSAVASAMMKKKKKPSPKETTVDGSKGKEKDNAPPKAQAV